MMNNDPEENDDYDRESELNELLDALREFHENPPGPEVIFPKVDVPKKLLGASDSEREQFFANRAHLAVFDPNPVFREVIMPQYVMRALSTGERAPIAVVRWMEFVFREAEIPHRAGRRVDAFAKADFWHDLAVILLDQEEISGLEETKAEDHGTVKRLEDAARALAEHGHHAASYSKIRTAYYDKKFQELLSNYRKARAAYQKTVFFPNERSS